MPGFGLQNPFQGIWNPTMESGAPFLERPGNFSGPESCRRVCIQIKVWIILKMIKWSDQLTKQHCPVCELGTVVLFNRFWFLNVPSGPKSFRAFRETGPRIQVLIYTNTGIQYLKSEIHSVESRVQYGPGFPQVEWIYSSYGLKAAFYFASQPCKIGI